MYEYVHFTHSKGKIYRCKSLKFDNEHREETDEIYSRIVSAPDCQCRSRNSPLGSIHRVFRVPGFLSSRPNWGPQPPHPQESVAPPPFESKGGDTPCLAEEGAGGPNSDDGTDTLVYSRYTTVSSLYVSIQTSSDTVESERWQMNPLLNKVLLKSLLYDSDKCSPCMLILFRSLQYIL
jgi:hypothetical protein